MYFLRVLATLCRCVKEYIFQIVSILFKKSTYETTTLGGQKFKTMKIVIIEDEVFAARRLENMIRDTDPTIEIVAKLESVTESVEWFKNNDEPDLIFLDIQLEDDLSFAIFREVPICCSIIFTTATDEYATRAFQLKSIDYLLKPIIQVDLEKMIAKYKNVPKNTEPVDPDIFNEIIKIAPNS